MPRMAEKIAGTFAPKRASDGMMHSAYQPGHPRRTSQASHAFGSVVYPSSVVSVRQGIPSVTDETIIEDNDLIAIIQEANMDGVRHLRATSPWARTLWCAVIVVFVLLAMYQIYSQISLYHKNPVATNIEAEYPNSIPFPTIAVCNNNQFRLTYITGAKIMNRRPRTSSDLLKTRVDTNASVFNSIIEKTFDMDAVKFLRLSAHWKSRMILDCTWPNGTKCSYRDFKPVWTTTGLCWAINTDVHKPVEITGSGVGHGLRLLLNVESYERIDACTPHFRSKHLSGIKILIYNQTHVPESSLDGVNVPSGYSTGLPFRMQHRTKLPGVNCIEETDEHIEARENFDSSMNIRTCAIRKYLDEIENTCNCSMRRLFHTQKSAYGPCLVDDYFSCVQDVIRIIQREGTNSDCLPPCETLEYMAWQDMNRMPTNIMPAVIEETEEEDEHEVTQEDIEDDLIKSHERKEMRDETHFCHDEDDILTEHQVMQIKRDAHRAYEKQSRYQDDIFLRTKRLIFRLRGAIDDIVKLDWGWRRGEFKGIYERLTEGAQCFATFGERHEEVASIMRNRPSQSEERRASQVFYLVDQSAHAGNPHRFKTINDVKSLYGDRVDNVLQVIDSILTTLEKMWHLYEEKTYTSHLTADLRRMDRILSLMSDYENNRLQRRVWAEKMHTRQMRHFFEDEFNDGYYQVIMKDLDQSLRRSIHEVEKDDWPKLKSHVDNGTAFKTLEQFLKDTGAILFFESPTPENQEKFKTFLMDVHNCTMTDVKKVATKELAEFKKSFRQLQAAYNNLFKKELPDFLENFEFGSKFVRDNFAMVNIHFHQMYIERWSQDRTYTFWSLACDIGGALGLFLGASLLTIIELIYLFFQYGFCTEWMNRLARCDPWSIFVINKKKKRKENGHTPSDSMLASRIHHENLYPKKDVWSRSPRPHHEIPLDRRITEEGEDLDHPPPYRHSQDLSEITDDYASPMEMSQTSLLVPPEPRDRLSEITEENSNMDSEGRMKPPQPPPVPPHRTEEEENEVDSPPPSSSMDLSPPPALFSSVPEKSTTL